MRALKYGLVLPALLTFCGAGVASAEWVGLIPGLSAGSSARSGAVVATVHVDPLIATLTLQMATVATGQGDVATAAVLDHSKFPLNSAAVVLVVPPGVSVSPSQLHLLGVIGAGATVSANWTLCSSTAGTYRISADVIARETSGQYVVAYTRTLLLTVTKGRRRC